MVSPEYYKNQKGAMAAWIISVKITALRNVAN